MTSVSKRSTRGRLASMRNRADTRDFVLDQLSGMRQLRAQAMFGGIGLYADEVFFGILAADVLYFKVGDTNRADYQAAGSAAFVPYEDRPTTMPYFAVPVEVLESPSTLLEWASRSIAVAKASARSSRGIATAKRRISPPKARVTPSARGEAVDARKTTGRTPR